LVVTTGVGKAFTVTATGAEVAEQPAVVTITSMIAVLFGVTLCVVSPVDHK
jgi:hypothetical protein